MAVARLGARLAKLGVAGAAVAAGAVLKLVDSQQRALDTMGKLTRRSGINITAYQELKHAADLSGVAHESFDKALVKFTRNLGDAKGGVGALQTLLKANAPVFLEQLKNTKDVGTAFELMTAAMGKIEDPSVRASLAAAAFGRAGADMTLIMEGGAEGLRKAREEAHELGLVVGEDATRAAEDYVDSMTRLKGAVSGLFRAVSVSLGPELKTLADRMKNYLVQNRAFLALKVGEVMRELGKAVRNLWNWLRKIDWRQVVEDVRAFFGSVKTAIEKVGGLENVIKGLGLLMAGSFAVNIARGAAAITGAASGFTALGAAAKVALPLLAAYAVAKGIETHLENKETPGERRTRERRAKEAQGQLDLQALGAGELKYNDDGTVSASDEVRFRADAASRFVPENAAQAVEANRASGDAASSARLSETLALLNPKPFDGTLEIRVVGDAGAVRVGAPKTKGNGIKVKTRKVGRRNAARGAP